MRNLFTEYKDFMDDLLEESDKNLMEQLVCYAIFSLMHLLFWKKNGTMNPQREMHLCFQLYMAGFCCSGLLTFEQSLC